MSEIIIRTFHLFSFTKSVVVVVVVGSVVALLSSGVLYQKHIKVEAFID